jgi:hypothetical protein
MLFREANYHLHLAQEEKMKKKFEVMGARRAARMDVLLDPRRRTMGVDKDFLVEQEQAVHAKKEDEKAEEKKQMAETAAICSAVSMLERQEAAATRAKLQAAASQSATKESSDTWDLNDPKMVLKTMPARIGLDDPRLGPSSIQVFSGEDPLALERKAIQSAQFRAWLKQVQEEKDALKKKEYDEMMAFSKRSDGVGQTVEAIEKQQATIARQRFIEAKDYNLRMIGEKAAMKMAAKAEDEWADKQAMNTLVTSGAGMGFLGENVSDGVSHANPNRIRPDYYRGRPSASGDVLMNGYKEQMKTRIIDKEAQKALDLKLAAEAAEGRRLAFLVERQHEEDKLRRNREMKEALDKQLQEAEARKRAQKEEDHRPAFTKDFFEAFGKTDF